MNTTLHPSVNHKPGDWGFLLANLQSLYHIEQQPRKSGQNKTIIDRNTKMASDFREKALEVMKSDRGYTTSKIGTAVGFGRAYTLIQLRAMEEDKLVTRTRGVKSSFIWRLK